MQQNNDIKVLRSYDGCQKQSKSLLCTIYVLAVCELIYIHIFDIIPHLLVSQSYRIYSLSLIHLLMVILYDIFSLTYISFLFCIVK